MLQCCNDDYSKQSADVKKSRLIRLPASLRRWANDGRSPSSPAFSGQNGPVRLSLWMSTEKLGDEVSTGCTEGRMVKIIGVDTPAGAGINAWSSASFERLARSSAEDLGRRRALCLIKTSNPNASKEVAVLGVHMHPTTAEANCWDSVDSSVVWLW